MLIKYGVVGLCTNIVGYLLYLALTAASLGPKTAMTLLYFTGATMSFIGNRRWTFGYSGSTMWALFRFTLAHLIGYATNYGLLLVFHDYLGYPHAIVQAVAIVIVAIELFLLFNFFVFPQSARVSAK